jgi:hypothetical protein
VCVTALLASAAAFAGRYDDRGQFVGKVSPQIAAIFAEYPQGGKALTVALENALLAAVGPGGANPLIDDVLYEASLTDRANVKLAVAKALDLAETELTGSGQSGAARQLAQETVKYGDPQLLADLHSQLAANPTGAEYPGAPAMSFTGNSFGGIGGGGCGVSCN